MDHEAYDEQLRRAWKGDYSTTDASPWSPPRVEGPEGRVAPAGDREGARLQSRRQIESIVETEAVSLVEGRACDLESHPLTLAYGGGMKLAKFVKFREEKFGGVLFETRNEKVYTLNPTGAAVVREIVSGSADVVQSLKDRYQDDGRIAAEAQAFLDELKTKGLVEA